MDSKGSEAGCAAPRCLPSACRLQAAWWVDARGAEGPQVPKQHRVLSLLGPGTG